MDLERQTSRRLHEEHVALLELLQRFESSLLRPGTGLSAGGDPLWPSLCARLDAALRHEVTRHFALEEQHLFPRLRARGEGDLAELLGEEHQAIRAVVCTLLDVLAQQRLGALDAAAWRTLKAAGLELVERLGSHARKEQAALLPLVDEILDEQTDIEILNTYAAG